jgi:hypothetical protein
MLTHAVSDSKPATVAFSHLALGAAIALRDCSLRRESTTAERRACRTLMRGEALRWRNPIRMVFGL